MKTSLLPAAVAALGLVGCASSGHAPSSNSNSNSDFAQNSGTVSNQASVKVSNNQFDTSRQFAFSDPRNGEPLNLTNKAQFTKAQPIENPLVFSAGVMLSNAYATDASFGEFLDNSYGLVVFPMISNDNNDAMGSFNRGLVFENGRLVGESTTAAPTDGANQAFSQIVFFESEAAFASFQENGFNLPEGIPTFPIVDGAADWARYTNGFAVFTTAGTSNDEFAPAGGQSFTFFDFAE